MLALRNRTPNAERGARRPPHCRTCGKPMLGHNKDLCQLRSPSEESSVQSPTLGSIFEDPADSLPSTPPLTPTPTLRSTGSPQFRSVPLYPIKPISLEPSWEAPPDGTFYHRRNPHINNPLTHPELTRGTPLQRTASWISTEKADSEVGDPDADDYFASTLKSISTNTNAPRSRINVAANRKGIIPPLTPPTTPANSQNTVSRHSRAEREVDVIDAAGNKVVGLDISTLNENFKSIIHEADSAGYYAAIVRPRIGYNRGSVDIRTNEDADKHTTIFVSTSPDTMSINLICSEAFRKAKLITEGRPSLRTNSWLSVFLAMFLASLLSFWGSVFVIRTFG